MAVTKIKLEGFEKLAKTNKNLAKQLRRSNKSIIEKEARRLKVQMKQLAPTDSFRLRRAIEIRMMPKTPLGVEGAVIGITHESNQANPQFRVGKGGKGWYPAYQEYGFFDKSGKYVRNSFIRPVILGNRARIKKAVKDAYNAVIKNRSLWAER